TKVLGAPELASDARFADASDRLAHVDLLDAIVRAWAADQDAVEAFHALQAVGVAAGPLLDGAPLAGGPHRAPRNWVRPLTGTDVGTYRHLGPAIAGLPYPWVRASPALGEDNEYVYKELLGLDDAAYRQLEATGIAVEDYLDKDGNPV